MTYRRTSELHNWIPATYVRQLHLRRTTYVSTPVQQYLMKLPTKTNDHFYNVWMDYRNHYYTDIAIINQCFCRCKYVLEIDHTSEKVSTVLSNHVSSLLAQQNHVVHLRNDMKTGYEDSKYSNKSPSRMQ